jgi:hypothetical protein
MIHGVDHDLITWIVDTAERPGTPPMLDEKATTKMRKTLTDVEGAELSVDPETGWWSVRHDRWLVQAEPWSSSCLMGRPDPIPAYTGQRVKMYRLEAARRRRTPPHEGVPEGAELLLTEIWLPASPLRPNPLGLDYDVVQLTVWRLAE